MLHAIDCAYAVAPAGRKRRRAAAGHVRPSSSSSVRRGRAHRDGRFWNVSRYTVSLAGSLERALRPRARIGERSRGEARDAELHFEVEPMLPD
jgi:hypothetical protein